MRTELFEGLTSEEFELLAAKLECGRLANLMLENRLYDLADGLSADYPYQERVADTMGTAIESPRWKMSCLVTDAIWKVTERANAHRQIRDEFHAILYA